MGNAVRVGAVALALAAAAAGCATVPTNGPVQQVGAGQSGLSQEQDYSQPVPVGPGQGWTPSEIVDGFLAASASFLHDHAVAREYLDSTAQKSWQPGWAVTVVSNTPTAIPIPPLPRSVSNESESLNRQKVIGLPVATITGSGQYLPYSGSPSKSYVFSLIKNNGQWRIDSLPTSQLLLTQADFQRVYQPRSLYFLSQSGTTLVPDPVFVPQQATDTDLANGLVNALLHDPNGWLSGAAGTGFPAHSYRLAQVRINGPNATVDLGGKAGTASPQKLEQMAAQLVWTLSTGPTPVQSVVLELNNRPVQVLGSQYQQLQTYQSWVPGQAANPGLYYVGSNGTVQELTGTSTSPVAGAAGAAGVASLSSVAVSPNGRLVAGISAGGAAVYFGALSKGATLKQWRPPTGSCTSVSWDSRGDLWITAGGIVWLLPPGGGSAAPVSVDAPPGSTVTDFQVAPDGVRVVMIVHGAPDSVELGAITRSGASAAVAQPPVTIGSGLPTPDAVTWYGADDIIVLAGSSSSTQLDEVPLNGGQPTTITTPGPPVSVTATSPQGAAAPDIAIGLAGGKIMVSANQGVFQPTRAAGQAPVYPS
jgi:hypothetical protein